MKKLQVVAKIIIFFVIVLFMLFINKIGCTSAKKTINYFVLLSVFTIFK